MITGSPAVQLGSTRRQEPLPPGSPWYKHVWRRWDRIARWIGNLLSRTVTTIAFVVVLPLFALGVRLFADPLALKPQKPRWTPLPPGPKSVDEAREGL
ncbi:MAG: hypothetical protein ABIS67_08595 [Candidatus Eisenbacteria bacterium]